jgi:hypothetical protein
MNNWLQQGAARLTANRYRPKTDRPILRAHLRALRRQLFIAQRASSRVLAADLLQARHPGSGR